MGHSSSRLGEPKWNNNNSSIFQILCTNTHEFISLLGKLPNILPTNINDTIVYKNNIKISLRNKLIISCHNFDSPITPPHR